eukprot:COSAG01_NODE_30649_length_611_cov_48.236328_1_plen_164_part_10
MGSQGLPQQWRSSRQCQATPTTAAVGTAACRVRRRRAACLQQPAAQHCCTEDKLKAKTAAGRQTAGRQTDDRPTAARPKTAHSGCAASSASSAEAAAAPEKAAVAFKLARLASGMSRRDRDRDLGIPTTCIHGRTEPQRRIPRMSHVVGRRPPAGGRSPAVALP